MKSERYVGPRYFTEEDSEIFFGRDREAVELEALVVCNSLVVLHAQSGVGKSSIVRARLLPTLAKEEQFTTIGIGRLAAVASRPPDSDERRNPYTSALIDSLGIRAIAPGESLADFVAEFIRKASAALPPGTSTEEQRYLLVIDQFEELFTARPELWAEREPFLGEIGVTLRQNPHLTILICIREEFLAYIGLLGRILLGLNMAWFRLERLTRDAARKAIELPIESTPVRYEPQALALLLTSLFKLPAEPSPATDPATEEGSDLPTATAEGEDDPGAEASGAEFAEPLHLQVVCQSLWRQLPEDALFVTETMVKRWGNIEEALEAYYDESMAIVAKECDIPEGTIRGWIERHFITPGGTRALVWKDKFRTLERGKDALNALVRNYLLREERRGRDTWFELAHDRLVTCAQRSNVKWREATGVRSLWQKLEDDAVGWQTSQAQDLLLSGANLRAANELVAQPEVADFGISQALTELIRRSNAHAEEAQRTYKRRVYIGAAVVGGLILSAGGHLWVMADSHKSTVDAYAEVVDDLSGDTEKLPLAISYALRALAAAVIDTQRKQPIALLEKLLAEPDSVMSRLGPVDASFQWAEFAPDSTKLAGYGGKGMFVWSTESEETVLAMDGLIWDAQFSSDGRQLAVTVGKEPPPPEAEPSAVSMAVAVIPLDRRVGLPAQVWRQACEPFIPSETSTCATLSSDFELIAFRVGQALRIVRLGPRQLIRQVELAGDVSAVSFAPNGQSLIVTEPPSARRTAGTVVTWYSLKSDQTHGFDELDLQSPAAVLWSDDSQKAYVVDRRGERAFYLDLGHWTAKWQFEGSVPRGVGGNESDLPYLSKMPFRPTRSAGILACVETEMYPGYRNKYADCKEGTSLHLTRWHPGQQGQETLHLGWIFNTVAVSSGGTLLAKLTSPYYIIEDISSREVAARVAKAEKSSGQQLARKACAKLLPAMFNEDTRKLCAEAPGVRLSVKDLEIFGAPKTAGRSGVTTPGA